MHKWAQQLVDRIEADELMQPVKNMKYPLTVAQASELLETYDARLVWEKLNALAEFQETATKQKRKTSAFRCLLNWCRKEISQGWKPGVVHTSAAWMTTYDGAITWLERRGMKAADIENMFERFKDGDRTMYRKRV